MNRTGCSGSLVAGGSPGLVAGGMLLSALLRLVFPPLLAQAALGLALRWAVAEAMLRLSLAVSALVHEWAHLAAIIVLSRPGWARRVLSPCNLLGHVPLAAWLCSLLPCAGRRMPSSLCPHVTLPPGLRLSPRSAAAVTAAGPAASVAVAVACLVALAMDSSPDLGSVSGPWGGGSPYQTRSGSHGLRHAAAAGVALGAVLTAAGALASDVFGLHDDEGGGSSCQWPRRSWSCGNFGVLLAAMADAAGSGVDVLAVLRSMAMISMQRGGQSGGLVTFQGPAGNVQGLRTRYAPSKRESLAEGLHAAFCATLRGWSTPPWSPPMPVGAAGHGLFLGHTRFATSSVPRAAESHPHAFSPPRRVAVARAVWSAGGDCVVVTAPESHSVFITHNGDLEYYSLFGRDRTHREVGALLESVLGVDSPAECDSVKVAGIFELLRCQGVWASALRLAWLTTICPGYDDAVAPSGHGFPTTADLAPLVPICEAALAKAVAAAGQAPHDPTTHAPTLSDAVGGVAGEGVLAEALGMSLTHDIEAIETALHARQGRPRRKRAGAGGGHAGMRTVGDGVTWEAEDTAHGLGFGLEDLAGRGGLDGGDTTADVAGGDVEAATAGAGDARDRAFAAAAVSAFLHADLFHAATAFFAAAKGSFGLVVGCTLDPDTAIVAAWSQAMFLAFEPASRAVLYSSESQSLKINLKLTAGASDGAAGASGWRAGHCTHRLDVDEAGGEVYEIKLSSKPSPAEADIPAVALSGIELEMPATDSGDGASPWRVVDDPSWDFVHLRGWSVKHKAPIGRAQLIAAGRLLDLATNPWIVFDQPAPPPAGSPRPDLVRSDLDDIPRVLGLIRASWSDPASLNRQSGRAFFAAIETRLREFNDAELEARQFGNRREEVDLLIVGIENSLWLGDELAANLSAMLPRLRCVCISANKVIGTLGNARGHVAFAGSSFSRSTVDLNRSVVLILSHSGQTFPTLHATRILQRACPGRVFAICGGFDRKVAQEVGQSLATSAAFAARTMTTFAGWRGAEPCTVSTLAMHHSLSELLVLIARYMSQIEAPTQRLYGLTLLAADVADLDRQLGIFVAESAPEIVGRSPTGPRPSPTHAALVATGRHWALHVLEGPWSWMIAFAYILVTVFLGLPLFTTFAGAVGGQLGSTCDWSPEAAPCGGLRFAMAVLDILLYVFCPQIAALALRWAQSRPLLTRFGKRTLVIAEVPYVHQVLESFVSKLFALSYGIASLEVHGAEAMDSFAHLFTHRVARGLLLAVGRPDGRVCSLTRHESWTLMALLQAKVIQSLGAQPEVLSVGHNPYGNGALIDHGVVLPTRRGRFLCESLAGPADGAGAHPHGTPSLTQSMTQSKTQSLTQPKHTHADPGQALSRRDSIAAGGAAGALRGRTRSVLHGYFVDGTLEHEGPHQTIGRHLVMLGGGNRDRSGSFMAGRQNEADPAAAQREVIRTRWRSAAAAGLARRRAELGKGGAGVGGARGHLFNTGDRLRNVLEAQGVVEGLVESRVVSAERLLAFFVLFHAMAHRVATTWPLRYDLARSQSGLRIATTAAPVSAADLEKLFEEGASSFASAHSVNMLAGGQFHETLGGAGGGNLHWDLAYNYMRMGGPRSLEALATANIPSRLDRPGSFPAPPEPQEPRSLSRPRFLGFTAPLRDLAA